MPNLNEKNNFKKSSMVRIDYEKPKICHEPENTDKISHDPYEFIPSQNKVLKKKEKQLPGIKKKGRNSKNLGTFKNKNNKNILLSLVQPGNYEAKRRKPMFRREYKLFKSKSNGSQVTTASQKFNQLLLENKEEEKKKKENEQSLMNLTQETDSLRTNQEPEKAENVIMLSEESKDLGGDSPPSFASHLSDKKEGKKIKNLNIQQASEVKYHQFFPRNESKMSPTEKKLIKNKSNFKSSKLMEILKELSNDNTIYSNYFEDSAIKLPEVWLNNSVSLSKDSTTKIFAEKVPNIENFCSETTKTLKILESTQSAGLIGFCTQEELPEEKIFKSMVANIENELKSVDFNLSDKEHAKNECSYNLVKPSQELNSKNYHPLLPESSISRNKKEQSYKKSITNSNSSNAVPFSLMKKNDFFINFVQLGRLTPPVRRTKSCVVKLVFPIGFTSFTKRRAIESRNTRGVQDLVPLNKCKFWSSRQSCFYIEDHSTKSSSKLLSSLKQGDCAKSKTSQASQELKELQSSILNHPEKASLEIQTSQVDLHNIGIQTSQTDSDLMGKLVTAKPKLKENSFVKTSLMPCQDSAKKNFKTEFTSENGTSSKSSVINYKTTVENLCHVKNSTEVDSCSDTFSSVKPLPELINKKKRPLSDMTLSKSHLKLRRLSKDCLSENIEKINNELLPSNFIKKNNRSKLTENTLSINVNNNLIENVEPKKNSETSRKIFSMPAKNENNEVTVKGKFKPWATKNMLSNNQREENSYNYQNNVSLKEPISSLKISDKNDTCSKIDKELIKENNTDLFDSENKESEENSETLIKGSKEVQLIEKMNRNESSLSKEERDEESDSDFFVEQTPPKLIYSTINESRSSKLQTNDNLSGFPPPEGKLSGGEENKFMEGDIKTGEENESFLIISDSQVKINTPEKNDSKFDKSSQKKFYCQSLSFAEKKLNSDSTEPLAVPLQRFNTFAKSQTQEESCNKVERKSGANLMSGKSETSKEANLHLSQKKIDMPTERRLCIVASSIKNSDLIKKFTLEFKSEYSSKPTKEMTHLIVGLHENEDGEILPLCTPKFLFAIANKKWIVSEFWIESCLKMKTILPEESFETCDPVGGSGCRDARLSTDQLFENCEVYLLGNFQNILKEELADLILDSGGILASKPENFSFLPSKLRMIIADKDCLNMNSYELKELYEKYNTIILSRDVIIMSVQCYKLCNFYPYLLYSVPSEDLIRKGYPDYLVRQE